MEHFKFVTLQFAARLSAISPRKIKILAFIFTLFLPSLQQYPTEHCGRGPLNCTILLCQLYNVANIICIFAPYDASQQVYFASGSEWGASASITSLIGTYSCSGLGTSSSDCCQTNIKKPSDRVPIVQLNMQFMGTPTPSGSENYTIHMAHYEKCFPGQANLAQSLLPERATECLDLALYCYRPLFEAAAKLNPASVKDLEKIESLLVNVSRKLPAANKIDEDHGHAQLYIELIKHIQSEYNFNDTLGSTHIDFTLQTNGVSRFVIAVFVFKINKTGTAQTQPIKAGSLSITRYIAPLNTTYIVIVGWNADSFLSSRRISEENHQLPGNACLVVPPTPLESICKEMAAESQNTSNLVINKLEPICLYYDRDKRKYSDRGCVTITDDVTGNVTCKCNHLTVFTVLLAVQSTTIPEGVKITSYTTESASVMFLIATTVILYKSKHSGDRVPVQINLSVALLLFHAVNLLHDLAVMHEVSCVILTATLQYLLLCAGMWFLMEGVRLFMATSCPVEFRTQDSSKRLKIFMVTGWIIPAFIVGISMTAGFPIGIYMQPQPLHEQCNEFLPIPKYDRCWLAPGTPIFYATVVAPLALVLLTNFLIIVKTTHVMLNSRKMRNRGEDPGTGDALRAAKSFALLFLMLGGTWILAFFTGIGNEISNEVFMYIHGLVNGSQGIVVFLLYCVMDDDIIPEILPCKRKADVGSGPQPNAEGVESSSN